MANKNGAKSQNSPMVQFDTKPTHSHAEASKSAFLRSPNMADTYIGPWQLHSRFQSCDPFGSFGLRGGSSECGNGCKVLLAHAQH